MPEGDAFRKVLLDRCRGGRDVVERWIKGQNRIRWLRPDGAFYGFLQVEGLKDSLGFCQKMVRSIVGTLVAIGQGKRTAGEVAGMLRRRDRAAAPPLAPPHGLCLWEVTYP